MCRFFLIWFTNCKPLLLSHGLGWWWICVQLCSWLFSSISEVLKQSCRPQCWWMGKQTDTERLDINNHGFFTINVPQPLHCALFWCALMRLSSWYSLASFAGAHPLPIIHSLHGKVSPTSPQEAQTTVVHNPADGTKVSCFYSSHQPLLLTLVEDFL